MTSIHASHISARLCSWRPLYSYMSLHAHSAGRVCIPTPPPHHRQNLHNQYVCVQSTYIALFEFVLKYPLFQAYTMRWNLKKIEKKKINGILCHTSTQFLSSLCSRCLNVTRLFLHLMLTASEGLWQGTQHHDLIIIMIRRKRLLLVNTRKYLCVGKYLNFHSQSVCVLTKDLSRTCNLCNYPCGYMELGLTKRCRQLQQEKLLERYIVSH